MKSKYLELIYWILPIMVAISSIFFLKDDALYFLKFYLALFLLGIVFVPLSNLIFNSHSQMAYMFSKPLSMLLASFVSFTFAYLKLVPFRTISLYIILFLFLLLFYSNKLFLKPLLTNIKKKNAIRNMALSEAFFGSMLLIWTFARGLKPLVDSLEKPMNYGFMMSLMRSDFLPAADMWYAGGDINYYYFGQFVYTFITKVSRLSVEVTYNLSLAATFALTVTLSFAIGYMLVSLAIKKNAKLYSGSKLIGGLFTSILVSVAGNSHAFFYGSHYDHTKGRDVFSPGYKIMEYLQNKNLLNKWLPVSDESGEQASISIKDFWFANSTRFIGYNPPTNDKTIHEFPFYSFLVADLHAHLINLTFVLLLIGILIVFISSNSMSKLIGKIKNDEIAVLSSKDMSWLNSDAKISLFAFKHTLFNPFIILLGIILGAFMMTNFWDFAIYIVVIAMVLLIKNMRSLGNIAKIESVPVFVFQSILILIPFMLIENPIFAIFIFMMVSILCFALLILRKDALTITGAMLSILFLISHLFVLPFNAYFDPMSKSISLTVSSTPLFQFFILWGTHILVGVIFVLYVISRRIVKKRDIGLATLKSSDRITRFFVGINLSDILVSGIFICGIVFLILPEIFYVVDIYSGDFKRANTMFKFTYQAFTMLSIVFAYAMTRIAFNKDRFSKFDLRWQIAGLFMIFLIFIPSYYTVPSTKQWLGNFSFERYKGINGIQGLPNSDRIDAIRWLNENISGQPVLLESYGDSYTEYNQITAYTGLPTVMGWQTHQWLWRTSKTIDDAYGQIVRPRQMEVEQIYQATDLESLMFLIEKYSIEMIVVGDLEREKFSDLNEELLLTLGDKIFDSDRIYIIGISSYDQ